MIEQQAKNTKTSTSSGEGKKRTCQLELYCCECCSGQMNEEEEIFFLEIDLEVCLIVEIHTWPAARIVACTWIEQEIVWRKGSVAFARRMWLKTDRKRV
ncbi:hypothetical protein GCK32_000310 [Trichostrongylus colubriformis]|uniref:Uncharacterized protein n=1 Tax=Trichostrongylus colubriformis TaxID=6319 RepID=A0AAN8EUX8_TRICO